MITFCKICLNPSTRPNAVFNNEGVCSACLYENSKLNKQQWLERDQKLNKIVNWAKKNKTSSYDCIIPISGGKDSYRQSFYVRDKLKLKPLLVCNSYPPEQTTDIGDKNLDNLVKKGFDLIKISLNPVLWKKLYKHSFNVHGNMLIASEMALFGTPVHLCLAYKIPLMFYGENPVHTIGEMHGSSDFDASGIRYGNTISGGIRKLRYNFQSDQDFYFYQYPSKEKIDECNTKIVYLGYFIKDWYGHKNAQLAIKNGLKIRTDKPQNTGDLWGFTGLDDDFRLVNQFLKYMKFGFGHVTDQVCEAIHQKFMSRNEAIDIVKKYDGKIHKKYIKKFCDYVDMPINEFWRNVDEIVNKELFVKKNGKWIRNFEIK